MIHYLIRYDELALKGKNRIFFERELISNIKLKLEKYDPKVQRLWGRIWLTLSQEGDAREILRNIFGISSFSPVEICESNLEVIKDKAYPLFLNSTARVAPKSGVPVSEPPASSNSNISFRVTTNRVDKRFSLTSQQMNIEMANFLLPHAPSIRVDLDHPDVELGIEIREEQTFLYIAKEKGLSGLPVGISGKVLTLLSGGIDSPVAAWQMMKRGCSVDFIHFYSYPYVGEQSKEKVLDLVKQLSKYQNKSKLFLVPFTEIQEEIQKTTEEKYRTLLYRRYMQRIATEVSKKNHYLALITGESLGQVASQTLENLDSVSQVTNILILRPLISNNKQETIEISKKIGTYEISIRPFDDCCTVFQSDHPATRSKVESLLFEEQKLSLDHLIKEAIEKIELLRF